MHVRHPLIAVTAERGLAGERHACHLCEEACQGYEVPSGQRGCARTANHGPTLDLDVLASCVRQVVMHAAWIVGGYAEVALATVESCVGLGEEGRWRKADVCALGTVGGRAVEESGRTFGGLEGACLKTRGRWACGPEEAHAHLAVEGACEHAAAGLVVVRPSVTGYVWDAVVPACVSLCESQSCELAGKGQRAHTGTGDPTAAAGAAFPNSAATGTVAGS